MFKFIFNHVICLIITETTTESTTTPEGTTVTTVTTGTQTETTEGTTKSGQCGMKSVISMSHLCQTKHIV